MLISNFEKHFDAQNWFPNHVLTYFSPVINYDRIVRNAATQLKDQNALVIIGIKTPYSYFGIEEYPDSETIDSNEKLLLSEALRLKIPVILVGRGYSLCGIYFGFEFRRDDERENHLNTYESKYYAVNSLHPYVYRYREDYRGDVYRIVNPQSYPESFYSEKNKLLSIAWNPELDSCPRAGKDLFDIYLNKTLGLTR